MVSLPTGFLVLIGAAILTYVVAITFEDETQTAYTGIRMMRGGFTAVVLIPTAVVFALSGVPSLMFLAVIIVAGIVLYLTHDHYSPFNR